MSYTAEEYRAAAVMLWGEAGAFVGDTFVRFNREYFGGRVPPLPIVIGLTAYGHCIGLTRSKPELPRISLASGIFRRSREVEDTLLHEMLHAELMLAGLSHKHNDTPWCQRIAELSPAVLGHPIQVAPVKLRRVDKRVTRQPLEDHLGQGVLARWPYSLRPAGYLDGDRALDVDTY